MSMSRHVVGFAPPDEEWKKMKAVWDACKAADIDVPQYVKTFFNDEEPDNAGVEVDLETLEGVCSEWRTEMCDGFEIDVANIPPHIKKIRFFTAY